VAPAAATHAPGRQTADHWHPQCHRCTPQQTINLRPLTSDHIQRFYHAPLTLNDEVLSLNYMTTTVTDDDIGLNEVCRSSRAHWHSTLVSLFLFLFSFIRLFY
jgi:hypothetical protein